MRNTVNKPIPRLLGTSLGKGRNSANANNFPILTKEGARGWSSAFTLVELIIVITILAILATIGFMSFQSYTLDARDANRITSLKTMSDGLRIYQAKKSTLPDPDAQTVSIMSGGLTISTQGYAGTSVLQKLKASDIKDPSDNNYYTYIVNSDKTKYQLLGMLEKDTNLAFLSPDFRKSGLGETAYARTDYTSRYAYTTGNKVGIFFSGTTNTPIQETISGSLVLTDATNSTKIFKVMFTNSTTNSGTITSTGTSLPAQIQTITNSTASTASTPSTPVVAQWKDIAGTNCTNDDITIGTQTWAGCNSVLGTTGISTNNDVYNGTCYNYAGRTTTTNCSATYMTGTAKENAYDSTNGEDNIWGKLYLWANAPSACPTGWHLPTDAEFEILETTLNGGTNCRNATDGWLCTGLGWSGKSSKNATNNIIKALKLPLAGNRNSGTFNSRGSNAVLWSSSEFDSTNARARLLNRINATVNRYYWNKTTYGFSVRCIKDL